MLTGAGGRTRSRFPPSCPRPIPIASVLVGVLRAAAGNRASGRRAVALVCLKGPAGGTSLNRGLRAMTRDLFDVALRTLTLSVAPFQPVHASCVMSRRKVGKSLPHCLVSSRQDAASLRCPCRSCDNIGTTITRLGHRPRPAETLWLYCLESCIFELCVRTQDITEVFIGVTMLFLCL